MGLTTQDIEDEIAQLEQKRARELAARDAAVAAVLKCDGAILLARHLLAKVAQKSPDEQAAESVEPVNRLACTANGAVPAG